MSFSTLLGTPATKKMIAEMGHAMAFPFACTAVMVETAFVKLNSNGTVGPITAATDKVFGIISIGNRVAGEKVTVIVPFLMIAKCQCEGAVDEGQLLNCIGYDTTNKLNDMSVAIDDSYACAVALTAAADEGTFEAGFFYSPVKVLAAGA